MQQQRSTAWSVTINNPVKADEENIDRARQNGWKVHGQLEVGETGTPHYQLACLTPQVRFSAVKKAFPRAHIEVCRDKTALMKYVNKEETRVESLSDDNKFYPSMQKLWDMFTEWVQQYRGKHNDWKGEDWLYNFDRFIRSAIEDGYVVETMAVNPQVRSIVKLYGINIIHRSLRRQTDRQTPENNVEVIEYNNADSATEEESLQEKSDEETDDEETSDKI